MSRPRARSPRLQLSPSSVCEECGKEVTDQKYFVHGAQYEQEQRGNLMIELLQKNNMCMENMFRRFIPMSVEKHLKLQATTKEWVHWQPTEGILSKLDISTLLWYFIHLDIVHDLVCLLRYFHYHRDIENENVMSSPRKRPSPMLPMNKIDWM